MELIINISEVQRTKLSIDRIVIVFIYLGERHIAKQSELVEVPGRIMTEFSMFKR